MIEQVGRKTLREYLNIEAVPACLARLQALEGLPIGYFKGMARCGLSHANAFMVEGFLALGAAVGIFLVAVLVRGGWQP